MTKSELSEPLSLERKLILILIVVGILIASFFGFRVVRSFVRIHRTGLQPGVTDVEAIRGWMPVPYIARVFNVPPDYLYLQIGVPKQGNDKNGLNDLNYKYYYGQPGVVVEKIKKAILDFHSTHAPIGGIR